MRVFVSLYIYLYLSAGCEDVCAHVKLSACTDDVHLKLKVKVEPIPTEPANKQTSQPSLVYKWTMINFAEKEA